MSRSLKLSTLIRKQFNDTSGTFSKKNDVNYTVTRKYKGFIGRKRRIPDKVEETIERICDEHEGQLSYQSLTREVSESIQISKTQSHHYAHEMEVKIKTLWTKPVLSDRNKMERLLFVLNEIRVDVDNILRFKSQANRFYIDESWFKLNLPCSKRKYYPNSPRFHASRSKSFIFIIAQITSDYRQFDSNDAYCGRYGPSRRIRRYADVA